MMWQKSKTLRVVVGGLLFLAALWFLYFGNVANYDTSTRRNLRIRVPPTEMFKHLKLNGKERHSLHWDPKAFFVSKRRVPNGPDPIHNRFRKVVATRQPPYRA